MDLGSLLNNTLIKNEEVNLAAGKIGDDTTEKDNEIEYWLLTQIEYEKAKKRLNNLNVIFVVKKVNWLKKNIN